MSIGLVVKLTHSVPVEEVLSEIGRTLKEILGLSFIPQVVAEEYSNREWGPLRAAVIAYSSSIIGFTIIGEPETAAVFTHVRNGGDRPIEEQGIFVTVEVAGIRTPLAFALVAAIAITIGRECTTEITDNMPFFSKNFDQSAESFVTNIKLDGYYDDYRAAAQNFYFELYGTQWIEE